jgi:mRNA interferase RelE/StbE
MYKLVVPKDVRELIRTMHPSLKKKVKASLKIILSEPYSGKALMDELSGLRSFRVSSFRIIYRIKDPERIELVAIGPRERIYEGTFRIIQKGRKGARTLRTQKRISIANGADLYFSQLVNFLENGNTWGRTFKIRFGDASAAHHVSLMLH